MYDDPLRIKTVTNSDFELRLILPDYVSPRTVKLRQDSQKPDTRHK